MARRAKGKSAVIAKAAKPQVEVPPGDAPAGPPRVGFLEGEIEVPDDFNRMGEREIAAFVRERVVKFRTANGIAVIASYGGPVRKV
jgi:hypothetical protein